MSKRTAVVFILLGVSIGVVGLIALPGGHGRFNYLIEVIDPRPAADSEPTAGLTQMGAVRTIVLENPEPTGRPTSVLLMPDLSRRLKNSDCSMGGLPEKPEWTGLAGASSGLKQGRTTLAGRPLSVCATLQSLGPLFDESLVMEHSPAVEEALSEAGWRDHARYLIFAGTWAQRNEVMSRLKADPTLLPSPGASIVSPADKPLLSAQGRLALSGALVLGGLFLIGWQLRGMSREKLADGFGRR